MNEGNIIGKLKILEVAIGKKMFSLTKSNDVKTPPSPLQFKILSFLLNNKGKSVNQKTLEAELNVSKATISGALSTMEYNGIISRTTSGTDGREKYIQLTDISLKRFQEMKKLDELINERIIKEISNEDLKVFLSVIEKMKKNIEEIEDGEEKND